MATVAGQVTTFNMPNFHGELFQISPTDTPFLSAIGGLHGAVACHSRLFEWQTQDRRTSTANNSQVEGAPAPAGTSQSRANVQNVVEIHQSAVEVSYTKQAATAEYASTAANIGPDDNPINDELADQVNIELESMAVDVEMSFLTGAFANPATNATARKTRGLLTAITTNVLANGGTARPLTKSLVDTLLVQMYAGGARLSQDNCVFLVSPMQKLWLSSVYSVPNQNQPTPSRNIGGVAIDTVRTDFGTFGVMVDRLMPAGVLSVVDLSVCRPRFLEIANKGVLFVDDIAKSGASDKKQLYGEIGLEYGPETFHGQIKDLTITAPTS